MIWRMVRVTVIATLAGVIWGCSGDDEDNLPDFETLFAAQSGWTEDTSTGEPGLETATTDSDVVALINGGAGPFMKRDYTTFGIEHFSDGTYSLELRIWEFASTSVSAEVYDALLTESPSHAGSAWESASLGDAGRVSNVSVGWWFEVRKNAYLIGLTLGKDGEPAPDATSKQLGETFIKAILDKIP